MVKDDLVKTEPDFANGWYKDLQEGNVVGWVSAQWGDAILSGNAPKTAGKWRVAPMPPWDSSKFTSSDWDHWWSSHAGRDSSPKEAKDFAIWFNSDPDSIDLLIDGGYGWPATKDAYRHDSSTSTSRSSADEPQRVFAKPTLPSTVTGAGLPPRRRIRAPERWVPEGHHWQGHLRIAVKQAPRQRP